MTYKTGTLIAVVLGTCVVFLDSSVVTVALPRIGRELPTHLFGILEGQSYVYNGYLLAESALLILAGGLTDFYGRRRMFSIGVVGFGMASILSGLAPTMEWLVVFRVLQGVAGAFIAPGSLALITATFTGEEQGRAFGIWSGATAGLMILGPFIGGVLVDTVSWRAIFLVNVPFVVLTLWMVRRFVGESHDEAASGKFDVPGTILSALAVGGLVFGTISGQQREWHGPGAFAALGIGGAATILLPVWMLRTANPLVPPSLFRSRNFIVTNLSTLVIYAALAVTFYYLTLFMQGILGYTAAAAGVATIPAGIFMAVFSARFGALASRYGHAAHDVLAIAGERGELAQAIVPGMPDLLAEVALAARREQARSIGDVLLRRTRLGLLAARSVLADGHGESEPVQRVAEVMGRELGWDAERLRMERERFALEGRAEGLRAT